MIRFFFKTIAVCIAVIGSTVWIGGTAQSETPNIDYRSFLAQHDMVWDRIPNRWEVAPYTGNGNVGFLFYRAQDKAKNVISVYAGRHDYYDHRAPYDGEELLWIYRSRLPLGHFNLTSEGNITNVDLRLDLWNAELTGTIETSQGSYTVRGLTHSLNDVIYFETDTDNESIKVTWHPDVPKAPVRATLESGGGPKGGGWDKMRAAPYEMPPEPTISEKDGIQFCYQSLYQNRGETTTGWAVSGKPSGKQVLLASVHHSFPEADSMQTVMRNLQMAQKRVSDKTFFSTHRKWWNDYYPLSFLTIDDPEKEAFYWIQMYKFASATRGNGPVMDLMGPWYHKTFWPMVWGDLNVELQYWTHLTANRLDVGSSLCNWFDKHEAQLFKNVPAKWKDSAGLATLFPQDLVASQRATVPDMLCWILHDYWLHCQFGGDRQRMRDGLFSKLRGVGNSYLNYLKDNPVASGDGKIHIKNSWSPEYPGGRGKDINFTIGLMRWCFQTLLDINQEHGLNDPLADQWLSVVDNLVDFQIDDDGLRIGKDVPFDKPHRHYSHLLPFYPLAVLTPDTPNGKELLRTSLDHWLDITFNRTNEASAMAVTGYTATGAASMYAWLGDSDQAYHYLDYFIKHDRVSPTTMYAEGNPVIESPLSFATCIHDMLLQSWGGVLRVFPGAPTNWADVAFSDFRGQGAFLVSAKKQAGITQFVTVKSLVGSPCVVWTDIPNPKITIEGSPAALAPRSDGSYAISLQKGQTAILVPNATTQIDLTINPIPLANADRNLFGLNEKTTRLPGHQHYYKESPRPVAKRRPVASSSQIASVKPLPVGRYVRIELPGDPRTLSLAEVEVLTGGKNVAMNKKATQSSTVYGGIAERAVDGKTDGKYVNGSVTHTDPGGSNAWWEVDLNDSVQIDSIRIYNRKGNGDRLDGFTVHILDEDRKSVFTKENNPARPVTEISNDSAKAKSLGQLHSISVAATEDKRTSAGNETKNAWVVESQADWEQNVASKTNLDIKEGMATPTAKMATFQSIVKRFGTKKKPSSIVVRQSPVWENWEPTGDIGPGCTFDSPVFLSLGPKNYWLFARHNRKIEKDAWDSPQGAFVPKPAKLDGYDVTLETTAIPNQFRASGGKKKSLGGYHAWQSRDMVNWVHHGPITDKESGWMTTAEYVDGKAYFYYDFPNDQDPHLIIDDNLTDGEVGQKMGMAFDDPSHGSDCVFIRDLKGNFHVIYEDWSPIHANSHSFDSPLAGHAVSKDGKGNFKILAPAVDQRTQPTGVIKTYKHPHWVLECPERFKTDLGEYEVHQPEQNAYGDWAAIAIGEQYYLFGDYDPAESHRPGAHVKGQDSMSVAWFTSSSLDKQFNFCGHIGKGHPDPDICFADGRFWLATQPEQDFVSPGPWVETVELRVGVDIDNDGSIDQWTGWQQVKESYDYLPGFVKHVKRSPAKLDLTTLPAGYGFKYEIKIADSTENKSKPILEKVSLNFR